MKYLKILFMFFTVTFSMYGVVNTSKANAGKDKVIAKIKFILGREEIAGVIYDSGHGKDFLSILPKTFTFEDFNKSKKISYLSKRLSVDNVYKSLNPSIGDIAYYIPWGNIAIFYKDFEYSKDLIKIGKIEKGLDKFINMKDKFNVRIEIIKE